MEDRPPTDDGSEPDDAAGHNDDEPVADGADEDAGAVVPAGPGRAVTGAAASPPEPLEPDRLPATRLAAAAPSRPARSLAFVSIVIGGLCGGLIGYAFTDLQCEDGCTALAGIGGVVGALAGAVGVAIVAVLVLRAMDEWETVKDPQPGGHPARRRDGESPDS